MKFKQLYKKNKKLYNLLGVLLIIAIIGGLYMNIVQQSQFSGSCYVIDNNLNTCVQISCETQDTSHFTSRANCESKLILDFVTVYRYNEERNACDELFIHKSESSSPLEQSQQRCLSMIDPNKDSVPQGQESDGFNVSTQQILIGLVIIAIIFFLYRRATKK